MAVDYLCSLASSRSDAKYVEARYQSRNVIDITFANGELERMSAGSHSGLSIRAIVDGCWGFSSTYNTSKDSALDCLSSAISAARAISGTKKERVKGLKSLTRYPTGMFRPTVDGALEDIEIEKKIKITQDAEMEARRHSEVIKSAYSNYHEIVDHKAIANTDGTNIEIFDSKPEFSVTCIASTGSDKTTFSEGRGVTGGWNDLFRDMDHVDFALLAAEKATKLLEAKHAHGQETTVILDPGMVGLICHEAVGHMVEADFVLSGSIVSDRLGTTVGNEKVTIIDSGGSEYGRAGAGGTVVDDEGVLAQSTIIVKEGVLRSFLHNRETAFIFDVEPTGNARAFEYTDEPIIRMRNTFIKPGSESISEMIQETNHGYLVKGPKNGQADANGEFMFGCQELHLIEHGEITELKRGASISGNTFEVLKSVDMVGDDFNFDIGTGYCGKYQLAKVDGGGPHIRCIATVGSSQ